MHKRCSESLLEGFVHHTMYKGGTYDAECQCNITSAWLFMEVTQVWLTLCVPCTGEPWPAAKRKRFFWSKANRAGRQFTTEHVWTWQIYQHVVDMGAYELSMIYTFNLADKLDGQPLQFMVKDRCVVWPGCHTPPQKPTAGVIRTACVSLIGGASGLPDLLWQPLASQVTARPADPFRFPGVTMSGRSGAGVHGGHKLTFCAPSVLQGKRAVPSQLPCVA